MKPSVPHCACFVGWQAHPFHSCAHSRGRCPSPRCATCTSHPTNHVRERRRATPRAQCPTPAFGVPREGRGWHNQVQGGTDPRAMDKRGACAVCACLPFVPCCCGPMRLFSRPPVACPLRSFGPTHPLKTGGSTGGKGKFKGKKKEPREAADTRRTGRATRTEPRAVRDA